MIPPFIPDGYRERAYIAGGWAACPSLADDMDVWILATTEEANDPDFKLEDLRAEVLVRLNAVGSKLRPIEEDSEETGNYGGVEIKIRKVGYIKRAGFQTIHIMVTDAPIIEAVLANFDISTHQVAITPTGQVVLGASWTSITEPPQVIEGRENEHTPGRLEKITKRYKGKQ